MTEYNSDSIISKKSYKVPAILCVVSLLITIAFVLYCVGLVAFFSDETKRMLGEKFGRLPLLGLIFAGVLIGAIRELLDRKHMNKHLKSLFSRFDMKDILDQVNNQRIAEFPISKSVPCILTQKYIIVPGVLAVPVSEVDWINEYNTGINGIKRISMRTVNGHEEAFEYDAKYGSYDNLCKYLPTVKADILVGRHCEDEYRERMKMRRENSREAAR